MRARRDSNGDEAERRTELLQSEPPSPERRCPQAAVRRSETWKFHALHQSFSRVYASVSSFPDKEARMRRSATALSGRVEAVLVAHAFGDHVSVPIKKIHVIRHHGVRGDNHAGTRLADVRERALLDFGIPKGTEIANHREFSAVSQEQLDEIAAAMGAPSIPHGCLGENLVVRGIPNFTALPSGTLLFFRKSPTSPRTAVLAVWGENSPCLAPGEAIQTHYPNLPKLATLFPKVAIGK